MVERASMPPTSLSTTMVAMVGLPARGKTYIATKLARYLTWKGHLCRVFNVGSYRRKHLGHDDTSHEFFDFQNQAARETRNQLAQLVLDEALGWLRGDGEVAIYDATNITAARRRMLADACAGAGVRLVFVETVCDEP